MRTILSLAKPGLEIVEREIAHLILEVVEVHGGGLLALSRSSRWACCVEREGWIGWQQLGATWLQYVGLLRPPARWRWLQLWREEVRAAQESQDENQWQTMRDNRRMLVEGALGGERPLDVRASRDEAEARHSKCRQNMLHPACRPEGGL